MSTSEHSPADDNQLMAERRDKLAALRQQGIAFPNDVKPEHRAAELFAQYDGLSKEELQEKAIEVSVAGRMMLKRVMGKASFATLQDASLGKAKLAKLALPITRLSIMRPATLTSNG